MSDVVVIGSLVTDLKFYTKFLPKIGETVVGKFKTGLGGKGFNQAVACRKLGIPTTFVGQVGEDAQGEEFVKAAKLLGLDCRISVDQRDSTGAASIVVDSQGNNQLVVSLGANETLCPDFVIDQLSSLTLTPKVIVMQLETSPEVVTAVLEYVQAFRFSSKIKPTVILNPAPMHDFNPRWLELVDFITPNETEYESLRQLVSEEALLDTNCVSTLGKAGAKLRLAGRDSHWKLFPPIEAKEVDTTGAGDCFNGGLAAGLVKYDYDIEKAIKLANVVAGLSVQKEGTSESSPTQEDLKAFLHNALP